MIGDGKKRDDFRIKLDSELMAEAEALGINIQRACEDGIRVRIAEARQWLEENRDAIESWNAWVDEHGLPLSEYRQF